MQGPGTGPSVTLHSEVLPRRIVNSSILQSIVTSRALVVPLNTVMITCQNSAHHQTTHRLNLSLDLTPRYNNIRHALEIALVPQGLLWRDLTTADPNRAELTLILETR
jgi:hypothetical protein